MPARSSCREADIRELHEAEEALASMQTQLSQALRQQRRLASLGGAVARVSHDLRNMLTTATLLADRLERSSRIRPCGAARRKLVGSLKRAVGLCEATLSYGRAEEPAPVTRTVRLDELVAELLENEALAAAGAPVRFHSAVPVGAEIDADPEQLYRILANLVRNACQAVAATGAAGRGAGRARNDGGNGLGRSGWPTPGPACPKKARETLFQAFKRNDTRRGGTGLGLSIAADLARGHGGRIDAGTQRRGGDGLCRPPAHPRTIAASRRGPGREAGTARRQGLAARTGLHRPATVYMRTPGAPVAQLDRAPDYESGGRGFESSPVRHSSIASFERRSCPEIGGPFGGSKRCPATGGRGDHPRGRPARRPRPVGGPPP
jgi:hypothetical protein